MNLLLVALIDLVLVVITRVRAYDKIGFFATHSVHNVRNMKLKTRFNTVKQNIRKLIDSPGTTINV